MFKIVFKTQNLHLKQVWCKFSTLRTSAPLKKVLIANRGEISCRVIKTCKKLGFQTVAVFSEADKNALHVSMADEAYCIGPAASQESYLNQSKIISVAKKTNAEAIHPGYGFLSENADFADLCQQQNLVFIGPPASAIRDMGIKSTSKSIMSKAGVPVIKGYHGEDQTNDCLKREAKRIGFPVMLKAVKGGGGKGMRIVTSEEEFESQLDSARREALNSFGDDAMLVEQFVERPRHVEVQVFGDVHGNYIYLFERDCSVQRRHQKIIEEAPAPGLNEATRISLGEAAVRAAKAVKYVGAGTVEFIMDENNKFYFMEMNTRLQVEHPVTEMITGTDLVEWQLRVASGEKLPLCQEDLNVNGHSFEARIYAEDPDNSFMPGAGRLSYLFTPEASENVRIETGICQGDAVSVHYDPMIAKLVVWGKDRKTALQKLHCCLSDYNIVGVKTNVKFLMSLASHKAFHQGNVHTNFISEHEKELFPPKLPSHEDICSAVLSLIYNDRQQGTSRISFDEYSPFSLLHGTLPNLSYMKSIKLHFGEKEYLVDVQYGEHGNYIFHIQGKKYAVCGRFSEADPYIIHCTVDNRQFPVRAVIHNTELHLFTKDNSYEFMLHMPKFFHAHSSEFSQKGAVAPMPGVILKVNVNEGEFVKKGDPLVVIVAMKMEYVIKAHCDGIVEKVFFRSGDNVTKNAQLVQIQEESQVKKSDK